MSTSEYDMRFDVSKFCSSAKMYTITIRDNIIHVYTGILKDERNWLFQYHRRKPMTSLACAYILTSRC